MKTTGHQYKDQFRERGSKFIGYLFPCQSEEEFGEKLESVQSEFPDATHHCYGWRINPANIREFSTDDGEPSGTAGLPILNQLKSYEVVNAGIIVVRYYGGTKLGKSGLIEAYGRSAAHCLAKAQLYDIVPIQKFRIEYPYSEENQISKLKNDFELTVLDSEYMEEVSLTVGCPRESSSKMKAALESMEHLGIDFQKLEMSFMKKG